MIGEISASGGQTKGHRVEREKKDPNRSKSKVEREKRDSNLKSKQ